jgi:hypothetical protein
MEITTLTATERNNIWRMLDRQQQEVFLKYMRIQMSDRLLNQTFSGATRWRLYAVNIDYD